MNGGPAASEGVARGGAGSGCDTRTRRRGGDAGGAGPRGGAPRSRRGRGSPP